MCSFSVLGSSALARSIAAIMAKARNQTNGEASIAANPFWINAPTVSDSFVHVVHAVPNNCTKCSATGATADCLVSFASIAAGAFDEQPKLCKQLEGATTAEVQNDFNAGGCFPPRASVPAPLRARLQGRRCADSWATLTVTYGWKCGRGRYSSRVGTYSRANAGATNLRCRRLNWRRRWRWRWAYERQLRISWLWSTLRCCRCWATRGEGCGAEVQAGWRAERGYRARPLTLTEEGMDSTARCAGLGGATAPIAAASTTTSIDQALLSARGRRERSGSGLPRLSSVMRRPVRRIPRTGETCLLGRCRRRFPVHHCHRGVSRLWPAGKADNKQNELWFSDTSGDAHPHWAICRSGFASA